jgi:hypothetical protein
MAWGRKTGGRQKGVTNKKTAAQREAIKQALASAEQAMADRLEDLDAHGFLRLIYRDRSQPLEVRIDCAKAAVRYEAPALSQTDLSVRVPPRELTDAELTVIAATALPAPSEEPVQITVPDPDDAVK